MFRNTKNIGYGEDTGWKLRYRLSTLDFDTHERPLNTNIAAHRCLQYSTCTCTVDPVL